MKSFFAVGILTLLASAQAHAQTTSFDARDTLLVDAGAVPTAGTIRGEVGGTTTTSVDGSGEINTGVVAIIYAPIKNFAIQVGTEADPASQQAPTASVRYQFLNLEDHGVNSTVELRYKTVGFFSQNGETEASVLFGRHFDSGIDVMANGVVGHDVAGEGADGEGRVTVGYRLLDELRAGLDARFREEIHSTDLEADIGPGRKWDLLTGPTVAYQYHALTFQALVGLYAPIASNSMGGAGILLASFDF